MSTIRTPVGPQPPRVYWRRRLAVLAGIVIVIVIIILIVARPGSGKPAAAPTHTASTHTAVATAPACKPANVQVVAHTDATSYGAGVDPMMSLTITNTGTSACSFNDGSNVQKYVITSGTDTIWSSSDCQTDPKANVSVLEPLKSVSSTPIPWDRERSSPTTCSATNSPQVTAAGASYHLTVTVNGITSSAANSPQFVLR